MMTMRPAVFHILLILSEADCHGLGIAEQVDRASGGTMPLGPGTLYRSLADMVQDGLIRSVNAAPPSSDSRRKYYRITAAGRTAVKEEATRLARLVGAARARNVIEDRT